MSRVETVTAFVNAKVATLPNLNNEQREVVRGIALSYALSHGSHVVDDTLVNEPNYDGIANHVRNNVVK